MTLVRRFKGRRFQTVPTGLVAAEVVEDPNVPEVQDVESLTPDSSWTVSELDSFAELNDIEFPSGLKKSEKLAYLLDAPSAKVEEYEDEDLEEIEEGVGVEDIDGSGYPNYEDEEE